MTVALGFERLFDANPRPLMVFDRETLEIVAVNDAAVALYGWTRAEMVAMSIREIRAPDDVPRLERVLASERAHTNLQFRRLSRHIARDGRAFDVDLEMSRVDYAGRRCTLCVIIDLDEEGAAIRRSEANFRTLIERLPTGTIVHRDGRIVYINPAAVRGLRYDTASELMGRPLLDFVHPDDHALVISRIEQTARGGRAPSAESRMVRRDGTIAYIDAEAVRLEFDGELANVVIAHEVTERRELFARVAAADRLLSMGTLAAGIAHEINNPLAYLVSNLEVLARDAAPAQAPLVADAREAADRVSAIVRDLRELSRPADDALGPVDVVDILASSIKMTNNELRHRARLVTSYAPDLPRVFASPSRLGQVFLNLLVNAAHAIVEGRADHEEVRVRATTDGEHVCVEIEDTGVGIPAAILGRVFDPFFTTKPHGVGIGLGLAIAHQIVTSVGGELTVTSTVGVGTTFRVRLHAASTAPVRPAPVPKPAPPSACRILIIDDEPAVGRAVSLLLSPEHDVTVVTHAADALVRLTGGESFGVILCDLMMPEMTGIELYERLPSAVRERFVFITGGAFTPQARAFLVGRPHLDKPFSEDQLRAAIARVTTSAATA